MQSAKAIPAEAAMNGWQTQCEEIFEKVSLLLQDRDELCSLLANGDLSLQELLLQSELSETRKGVKLLTVLDSVADIGKVRARKILQDRQSWKIGQFRKQELSDIVRQVTEPQSAA